MKIVISGDVANLTISRPEVRNALSRSVYYELGRALQEITSDSSIRYVVITGAGQNFSSGADLNQLGEGLPDDYLSDYWRRMSQTILQIRAMPQIVIAAVEGSAVGAGAALAIATDLVVVSHDARFKFSFAQLGLIPDAGTSQLLPALVGLGRARDLLLTGRWLEAQEAHDIGLAARIALHGQFVATIDELLEELRLGSGVALSLTKALIDRAALAGFAATVQSDGAYQVTAASSGEYRARLRRLVDVLRSKRSVNHRNSRAPDPAKPSRNRS